jgi:hypothetical protein
MLSLYVRRKLSTLRETLLSLSSMLSLYVRRKLSTLRETLLSQLYALTLREAQNPPLYV